MTDGPLTPRKRPIYLVIALVLAFALGTGGWMSGCETIQYYKADDIVLRTDTSLKEESERPRLKAATEHYIAVRDGAKKRAFPLGVASFLLGAALLSLAARGLAGRRGGRSALVQVVGVQAVLAVVAFVATREVRWAETEMRVIEAMANSPRAATTADERVQIEGISRAFAKVMGPAVLGVRSVFALAIIFALTRPRVRDLMEASAASDP